MKMNLHCVWSRVRKLYSIDLEPIPPHDTQYRRTTNSKSSWWEDAHTQWLIAKLARSIIAEWHNFETLNSVWIWSFIAIFTSRNSIRNSIRVTLTQNICQISLSKDINLSFLFTTVPAYTDFSKLHIKVRLMFSQYLDEIFRSVS